MLETVSATEAEAGTGATRRAWTAERVRQAINTAVPDWAQVANPDLIPQSKVPWLNRIQPYR